jgi:hypothetical protein
MMTAIKECMKEAEAPSISPVELASVDLVKRLRKLRWIGMEEEANRLQSRLRCLPATLRDTVIADKYCTD